MDKFVIRLEETFLDYPDPMSNAIIVYMTGCSHHCEGCHSPLLQIPREYSETNEEIVARLENLCKRADTNKIVLLGGDPLYSTNIELTKFILKKLAKTHDVCIFTGYSIDTVKALGVSGAKFYKCGGFDKKTERPSKKTDTEYVLASPNQNFYDSNYKLISKDGVLTFNNN